MTIGVIAGLGTFTLTYLAIALVLPWPIRPMYWSRAHEYALLATIFVSSAAAAFVSVRFTPLTPTIPLITAAAIPLFTAYEWWGVGDPTWLVVAISVTGVFGAVVGWSAWARRVKAGP